MVEIMSMEEWEQREGLDEVPSSSEKGSEHRCACGRTVCCGKHKGCKGRQEKIRIRTSKEARDY